MSTKITKYRVYKDSETGRVKSVQPFLGDWLPKSIPASADNNSYREYLEWVAEGNTAEEAD
mgnify:CR=1 FL=1|tara:strand:- start:6 stop:188 length:183 start_codon:yes stop_codon:yes gene_type:complete